MYVYTQKCSFNFNMSEADGLTTETSLHNHGRITSLAILITALAIADSTAAVLGCSKTVLVIFHSAKKNIN